MRSVVTALALSVVLVSCGSSDSDSSIQEAEEKKSQRITKETDGAFAKYLFLSTKENMAKKNEKPAITKDTFNLKIYEIKAKVACIRINYTDPVYKKNFENLSVFNCDIHLRNETVSYTPEQSQKIVADATKLLGKVRTDDIHDWGDNNEQIKIGTMDQIHLGLTCTDTHGWTGHSYSCMLVR